MKLYLIASESIRLIDEELEKIIKDQVNVEYFDLNNISISDLINEASYLSLFDDSKYIIAKNANIFGSDKMSEKDSALIESYLENPNDKTILIFVINGKIDSRKKITKIMKEKYQIIVRDKLNFNDLTEKIRYIVKKDGYTIDKNSINYLINNTLSNYDLIYNEIEKIKIYYSKPCEIKYDDVKEIVSRSLEENNFKIIEAIISKDLKRINILLDDMAVLKIEPINLINLLAREYRLMHMTKTLYEENKSMQNIVNELKLQGWQVEKILKNTFNYSLDELEKNLLLLNECDLEMKKVYFDKYAILKSYLLKILD